MRRSRVTRVKCACEEIRNKCNELEEHLQEVTAENRILENESDAKDDLARNLIWNAFCFGILGGIFLAKVDLIATHVWGIAIGVVTGIVWRRFKDSNKSDE